MCGFDADGWGGAGRQGNKIASEPQEGNVEYKLMLVDPSEERLTHLTTQLKVQTRVKFSVRNMIEHY